MATPTTIMLALKALCVPVIYPNGTCSPSITGKTVKFRLGKPEPSALDMELRDGMARVNFFPMPQERDVSRFGFHKWDVVSVDTPSITFQVVNNTIILAGTPTVSQKCLVIVNSDKPNPYVYEIQAGDTLNTVAANWAALIPFGSAVGNVVTVGGAFQLQPLMVTQGTAIRELKRAQKIFKITVRASIPEDRDIIADALDLYLAQITSLDFVDDYSAPMKYHATTFNDQLQKARLFERELTMEIEYPTTLIQTFYQIVDPYYTLNRSL